MYIPMGRKVARRPLGRVADFCPLCRGFQAFRVLAMEDVLHFYHLTFGRRAAVGHAKVCETCGLESDAHPEIYRSLSSDPDLDLEPLIADTHPDIRRDWAGRLLLESRIESRKLLPGERSGLIREAFDLAESVLARRDAGGRLDRPSHLGCLGTFLAPIACMALVPLAWEGPAETVESIAVGAGGVFLALAVVAILTDARRHARRAILPRLVAALRPLDPSPEEVSAILGSLKAEKSPLAEVVGADAINNALIADRGWPGEGPKAGRLS